MLGGQGGEVLSSDHGFGGGCEIDAAAGQDVQAEVAAAFGPFIGLLGQDGSYKPDDRAPVREDPDRVGTTADLSVQALGRAQAVSESMKRARSSALADTLSLDPPM